MRAETVAAGVRGRVRRSGAEGFTILEVLVALTVLGLVVGVLFEGIAGGLRRTSYEEARLALVLEAERILQRIDLDLGGARAIQSGTEGDLRWRLERMPLREPGAEPIQADELLLVRYLVTVEDDQDNQFAVETKRLRVATQAEATKDDGLGGVGPRSDDATR